MNKPIQIHPLTKPCKPVNGKSCKYLSEGYKPVCSKQGKCEGWKS